MTGYFYLQYKYKYIYSWLQINNKYFIYIISFYRCLLMTNLHFFIQYVFYLSIWLFILISIDYLFIIEPDSVFLLCIYF